MAYDFNIFYAAAHAILDGYSPYIVPGFYSPPALAYALIPLALLPRPLAFFLWSALNITALVALARRRSLLAILFLPTLFHLYVGQIDLLILAAGLLGGWPGLALATLKPQLAFFLFLYHRHARRRCLYAALAALALYMPTLPLLPNWLQAGPGLLTYANNASSLFGLMALSTRPPLIFAMVLVAAIITFFLQRHFWAWAAAFNPVSNIYSMNVFVSEIDIPAVVLSWLVLPLALHWHTGLPFVAISLYMLYPRNATKSAAAIRRCR